MFKHYFTVGLHDTDAAGVVFFAHLFRHAHEAYEALMTELGFPLNRLIAEGRLALPIVHTEADFRAPVRLGEGIIIELWVERVGEKSFQLGYRFTGSAASLRAELATVHAALEPATGSAVPLPDELRSALEDRLQ